MGIMKRLFGKDQREAAEAGPGRPVREGIPVGFNQEKPVLTITDNAKEKIRAVLGTQDPPADTIRVAAIARGKYSMSLEPEGKPAVDDTVLPYEGFQVFVDSQSVPLVEGATLEWVDTYGGGGFQFTNPNDAVRAAARKQAPEGPEGAIWRQIEEILDSEVNPAVASHGGHIELIDVQGNTVFVRMGGGCQGCGMATVTLKQGVERILREHLPDIEEVLDVTEHAEGRNPYYAPSTK